MPMRRRMDVRGEFFMHSVTYQVEYNTEMFSEDDILDIAHNSTQRTFDFEDEGDGSALITFNDPDAVEAFERNMKAEGFRRGSDR